MEGKRSVYHVKTMMKRLNPPEESPRDYIDDREREILSYVRYRVGLLKTDIIDLQKKR